MKTASYKKTDKFGGSIARIGLSIAALGLLAACASPEVLSAREAERQKFAQYPFVGLSYCQNELISNLDTLGITADKVESIHYVPIYRRPIRTDVLVNDWQTWVRLEDQPGALIVELEDRSCFTGQVYTYAGLSLDGVAAF